MFLWLDKTILSVSLWNWAVAIAASIAVFLAMLYVRRRLHKRSAERLRAGTDDHVLLRVAARTHTFALLAVAMLVGARLLDLPATWQHAISQLWFVAVVIQAAMWLDAALMLGLKARLAQRSNLNAVNVTLIAFTGRAVLWVVSVLAILDNMGVNITAFVASLGIGGVAVALAAQVVLSDLFASISIGLDKPFEEGDFIVVGSIAGSIEHVGLKTTRIRSLGGEQIVCSNTELLKQTIQNYKRMELRRIAFTFSVSYDTSGDQAQAIAPFIKQLISGMEGARFDRAHLLRFGDRGLEYEVVYYVLSAEYNRYMDLQQSINLALMRQFESDGVKFGRNDANIHVDRAIAVDWLPHHADSETD